LKAGDGLREEKGEDYEMRQAFPQRDLLRLAMTYIRVALVA
jgi:hypothetical protein